MTQSEVSSPCNLTRNQSMRGRAFMKASNLGSVSLPRPSLPKKKALQHASSSL